MKPINRQGPRELAADKESARSQTQRLALAVCWVSVGSQLKQFPALVVAPAGEGIRRDQ
jgi:hypothetical protein